jgi:glycosyltransferase involved in cell wall biosynthesis
LLGKLLAIATALGISTFGIYKAMTARVFNRNDIVYAPTRYTSIVMCSLNEEGFIERTLQSLEDQNVLIENPADFEFILIDSNSEDGTVGIAENYGWKVYQAPRGKLTARHIGMEKAEGDIIVSVDADTLYPPNWLNLVLRWFRQPNVVGVVTPRLVDPTENLAISYVSTWMTLIDVGPLLVGGMRAPGQSMALYKQAYFDVGGFNLNINQQNVHEMVREEEIVFAMKLRRLGRLPVEWQAPCFTSLRRVRGIAKGEQYQKWLKERQNGERF